MRMAGPKRDWDMMVVLFKKCAQILQHVVINISYVNHYVCKESLPPLLELCSIPFYMDTLITQAPPKYCC